MIFIKQNIMKINFDDIFNVKKYEAVRQTEKDSQVSTARGFDSLFTSSAKNLESSSPKINKQMLFLKRAKIMNTIKTTKQQNISDYKYYKPSRDEDQIISSTKNNKSKSKGQQKGKIKQKINNITQRLHKPILCHKKNCKNLQLQSFYQSVKEQHFYNPQHSIHQTRSLTETCERLKQPSKLHQRLYWEHKQREFRGIQLQNEYEQIRQKQCANIPINKSYLKNYIKFYDRLDNQVSRKVKKQKYYEQNPNLDTIGSKNSGNIFHPNIAVSMRSLNMLSSHPKIMPKTQKHAIKGRAQMDKILADDLFASLNNSFETLNRSQQIVRYKQNRMKDKFCSIFNNDGIIQISVQAIQTLSEDQFAMLFPLLQKIEELQKTLSIAEFQDIFQQYYQDLPVVQKQKLRSRKQTNKQKQKQSIKISDSQNQKPVYRQTAKKVKTDYLRKIENYV